MDEVAALRAQRDTARLANSVRHAALHATPSERVDLEHLIDLTRQGIVTTDDAIACIHTLRRTQDQRRTA
jgi:hypothetical protein